MRFSTLTQYAVVVSVMMLLSGCSLFFGSGSGKRDSGPPPGSVDVSKIPDAVPKVEPKSKCGNKAAYEVFGRRYRVLKSSRGFVEKGIASWYGKKFHGRQTANCEKYDMYAMTAAHKNLPLPTYVEVTNLQNGKKIVVRVNDRGPFHDNRIIDLSYVGASKLGMVGRGTALVQVKAIDPRTYRRGGAPVSSRARKQSGNASFYIQVGAFIDRQNAYRLQRKLNALGSIRVTEAVMDAVRIYRVQIGPLTDVGVADNIVGLLGDYGIWEHRIILK
ncbi:MAG: septal ring lytic transglycosylase RlpA family protein [Gammaproteobacteria bacterium]